MSAPKTAAVDVRSSHRWKTKTIPRGKAHPEPRTLISTLFWGWAKKEDLRTLVYASREQAEADEKHAKPRPAPTTWLERTREEVRPAPEYPFAVPPGGLRWYRRPLTWAVAFGVVVGFVNLVVLW